jgi:hypothetical protein
VIPAQCHRGDSSIAVQSCGAASQLPPPERVTGRALHGPSRARCPCAAGIRSERVLKNTEKEHRAPAAAVIAAQLKVILLACHPRHDVTDSAPRVEAVVQEAQLGLARVETKEAKRRAKCREPLIQFHQGARANLLRRAKARRSSAFAVGHDSGSHCVVRMRRISNVRRGQGRRNGRRGRVSTR